MKRGMPSGAQTPDGIIFLLALIFSKAPPRYPPHHGAHWAYTFDGGELTLDTAGKSARLYFLLPETPQGEAELAAAEVRHAFLNRYVTEELVGFLNDNQE